MENEILAAEIYLHVLRVEYTPIIMKKGGGFVFD